MIRIYACINNLCELVKTEINLSKFAGTKLCHNQTYQFFFLLNGENICCISVYSLKTNEVLNFFLKPFKPSSTGSSGYLNSSGLKVLITN
jgi:hypothetical protein